MRSQVGGKSDIRTAEPKQGVISKGFEMLTHPFTTASYLVKGQDVPDRFSRGEINDFDKAINVVDPTGLTSWNSVRNSFNRNDSTTEKALNIAGALPVIGSVKRGVNLVKGVDRVNDAKRATKGVINNASKVTKTKTYKTARYAGDINSTGVVSTVNKNLSRSKNTVKKTK